MSSPTRVLSALAWSLLVAPLCAAQSVLFTASGDSANDTFGQAVDIIGDIELFARSADAPWKACTVKPNVRGSPPTSFSDASRLYT